MRIAYSGHLFVALVVSNLYLGATGTVRGAIITYVESGTLSTYQGPNTLGLDGASFSVTETIDSAAVPAHYSFNSNTKAYSATYNTISTSLTITGSSVSGVDGTYTTALQLTVGSRPSGDSVSFGTNIGTIGGNNNVSIGGVLLPAGTVQINTYPLLPLYGPSAVQSFSLLTTTPPGNNITFYSVLNGVSSGTQSAVPEPSAFALFLSAAPCLAVIVGTMSKVRRGVLSA